MLFKKKNTLVLLFLCIFMLMWLTFFRSSHELKSILKFRPLFRKASLCLDKCIPLKTLEIKSWYHQNSLWSHTFHGSVFFLGFLWVLTLTALFSLFHELVQRKEVTSPLVESFVYIQFIMFHSVIFMQISSSHAYWS